MLHFFYVMNSGKNKENNLKRKELPSMGRDRCEKRYYCTKDYKMYISSTAS